jgi:hypothetical protein
MHLVGRAGRDKFLLNGKLSYKSLFIINKTTVLFLEEYGDSWTTKEASGRALVTMRNIVELGETMKRAG